MIDSNIKRIAYNNNNHVKFLDKDILIFNEEFSKESKINNEYIKNDEWTNLLLDFMSLKIKDSTDESIDSTDNIDG